MKKIDKENAAEIWLRNCQYTFIARPNSWEWADGIRSKLQTETKEYPWREACEELWSHVTEIQHDDYMGFKREDRIGRTPFESLDTCIEASRYPPMEVLVTLNDALKMYFWGKGKLSLEDVFFGPEKKGVGNYAARKARSKVYEDFESFLILGHFGFGKSAKKREKDQSLLEKIEEFLAYGKDPLGAESKEAKRDFDNEIDPESFLRGYKRWLKAGRTYETRRTNK